MARICSVFGGSQVIEGAAPRATPRLRTAARSSSPPAAWLSRYEVHLDRKLERMLAMLLRLKDLRQGASAG